MSTFLDYLVQDMRDCLQSIEESMLKGDNESAANTLLSFADSVTTAGDSPELLLEEQ